MTRYPLIMQRPCHQRTQAPGVSSHPWQAPSLAPVRRLAACVACARVSAPSRHNCRAPISLSTSQGSERRGRRQPGPSTTRADGFDNPVDPWYHTRGSLRRVGVKVAWPLRSTPEHQRDLRSPYAASQLWLARWKHPQDEDRAGRRAHHALCHTANKDVGQARAAVCAHDNQLARQGLRHVTDYSGGRAPAHERLDQHCLLSCDRLQLLCGVALDLILTLLPWE
jgi:hypothetical protein